MSCSKIPETIQIYSKIKTRQFACKFLSYLPFQYFCLEAANLLSHQIENNSIKIPKRFSPL